MDDLRKAILDYVRREYLEDDDDRPLTESNASGLASASGIRMAYFVSRKRLSDTIEKESTIPPVMSGVLKSSGRSSPSSRYSRRT